MNTALPTLFALLLACSAIPARAQTAWMPIGPFTGNARCMAMTAGGHYIVGGEGLFRSTDAGASWAPADPTLQMPYGFCEYFTEATAIARDAAGTMYASTAEALGVLRSTDGGAHWTACSTGLTHPSLPSVSYLPVPGLVASSWDRLYAATVRGVYCSTNGGGLWSNLTPALQTAEFSCIAEAGGGVLLAGCATGGMHRSIDSGASWTPANAGLGSPPVLTVYAAAGGMVYAGTAAGLFASADTGASWTPAAALGQRPVTAVLALSNGFLYAGTNDSGVFRSSDAGATWSDADAGLWCDQIFTLWPAPTGDLFAGTCDGLYRSTDGAASWAQTTFTAVTCHDVAVSDQGCVAAATDRGLYLTWDLGARWTLAGGGSSRCPGRRPPLLCAAFAPGGEIVTGAGVCAAGVERWPAYGAGNPSQLRGINESDIVRSVAVLPGGSIVADGGAFLRSTDNGTRWDTVRADRLRAVSFWPGGPCLALLPGAVFRSHDSGATWLDTSPQGGAGNCTAVATAPSGRALLGISTPPSFVNTVLRSTDAGGSWAALPAAPPNGRLNSLAFCVNGDYMAATDNGIHQSDNAGQSWSVTQTGIPSTRAYAVRSTPGGQVVAGFWKAGLFRTTAPVPVVYSSFTASAAGDGALLRWTTERERANSGFEVERSPVAPADGAHGGGAAADERAWRTLGFVAGAGTAAERRDYAYSDRGLAAGAYAYRLRQIDHDGSAHCSPEAFVEILPAVRGWMLHAAFPMPSTGAFSVDLDAPATAPYRLVLRDALGRRVDVLAEGTATAGRHRIAVDAAGLPRGAYMLALEAPAGARALRVLLLPAR